MKNYHNTNKESGAALKASDRKAKSQQDKVLSMFKKKKELTASDVWLKYDQTFTPITSIRRAITNLTTQGYLVKTNEMKVGIYNRNEHIYRIR